MLYRCLDLGLSILKFSLIEESSISDKARELREKNRQVIVKRVDVAVDLNSLLQQVKDGGIVAVYKCSHCGAKLKIGGNTRTENLTVCEHCGNKIETMELADFLKDALS